MKVHNYGNDYVQARKFKENVNNVCNQTAVNRPEPSGAISETAEVAEEVKTAVEEKDSRKGRKKKLSD